MTALIRAEALKLATIPGPWLLLLTEVLIAFAAVAGASLHQSGLGLRAVLAHGGFAALFALILGIFAVAGEYRHRTIADTFLGAPQRARVFLAKLGTTAALGAVFGLAAATVTVASTAVWFSVLGNSFDWASPEVWTTFFGVIIWNLLFAGLGVSIGAIITNLHLAIVAALAWIAGVELILGDFLGDFANWLPLAAGQALGNTPGAQISQAEGGLALLLYGAVFAVIAIWVTNRRDVT